MPFQHAPTRVPVMRNCGPAEVSAPWSSYESRPKQGSLDWLSTPPPATPARSGGAVLSTEEFRVPYGAAGRQMAVSVPRFASGGRMGTAGPGQAYGQLPPRETFSAPRLLATNPPLRRWSNGLTALSMAGTDRDDGECLGSLLPTPSAWASSNSTSMAEYAEVASECSTADTQDEIDEGLVTAATAWAEALLPPVGTLKRPTVGSTAHYLGTCKPCVRHHNGVCVEGTACPCCHLCDPNSKRRRKQNWQALRRAAAQADCPEEGEPDAPAWFFHPTFEL